MNLIKKNIVVIFIVSLLSFNLCCVPEVSEPVELTPRQRVVGLSVLATSLAIAGYLFYYFYLRDTDLDAACQDGDLPRVKSLLRWVRDVNTVRFSKSGEDRFALVEYTDTAPPIYFACRSRNVDVIKWMVDQKGADVNLEFEHRCEGVYIVRDFTDVKKLTPLEVACRLSTAEVVSYLLEKGADVNSRGGKRRDNIGVTALYSACDRGAVAIVDTLLAQEGVEVESDNVVWGSKDTDTEKPLHIAARGRKEIVQKLLEKGASVDTRDSKGRTPIHFSWAWRNSFLSRDEIKDVMNIFFENGLDVNAIDQEGNTILHTYLKFMSMSGRRLSVLKFLIEKGADIHARNNKGETPLMFACQNKRLQGYLDQEERRRVLDYLFSLGADINAESNEGKNALYFASMTGMDQKYLRNRNKYFVRDLIERGATVKDEYKDGGIRKENDLPLAENLITLFNNHLTYKKDLAEAVKTLDEGSATKRGIARERVNMFMIHKRGSALEKKKVLPKLYEIHKKDGQLVSEQQLKMYIENVRFDKTFLEDETYKDVASFAKAKEVKDRNGELLKEYE